MSSKRVIRKCINPVELLGICDLCNACGKIDPLTQKQSELKLYKQQLEEKLNFSQWIKGMEELQKKNIANDIKYFKRKIAKLKKEGITV